MFKKLFNKFFKREPVFILSSALRGGITEFDLLLSEATAVFTMNKNSLDNNGILWQLSYEDFLFEFRIENRSFIVTRNDDTCINPFNQIGNESDLLVFVIWSFTKIEISYTQKNGVRGVTNEIPTTPSSPPIELLKWARGKSLIPVKEYDSEQEFRHAIINCFQTIQSKIEESGGYSQFWNIKYGKNGKIESRVPKREIEVHPTVNCLLSDQSLLLSFEIIPEHKTGVGDLDFLIIGKLKSRGFTKVCVEFKNAHSADIFHGLTVQLPKYMRNVKSTFGIYCVLNYEGEWFTNPEAISKSKYGLFVELAKQKLACKDPILKNIREIHFSLSKPQSASKK